jgi:hypothetical protein
VRLVSLSYCFGWLYADILDISVTAHSAILRNAIAVLGHGPYPLQTGEMIPVVVKATPVARHSGANGTTNGISVNGSENGGVNGH